MQYKITAEFFFDNGQVKKLDWIEEDLTRKDTEVPLTTIEVEYEFRKLFLKYMKAGDVLTIPNINGGVSVIPFSKLYYAEVSVAEYTGEPEHKVFGELGNSTTSID